jgi:hypothetical protein
VTRWYYSTVVEKTVCLIPYSDQTHRLLLPPTPASPECFETRILRTPFALAPQGHFPLLLLRDKTTMTSEQRKPEAIVGSKRHPAAVNQRPTVASQDDKVADAKQRCPLCSYCLQA